MHKTTVRKTSQKLFLQTISSQPIPATDSNQPAQQLMNNNNNNNNTQHEKQTQYNVHI